jgi:type 1 fimbria pilin
MFLRLIRKFVLIAIFPGIIFPVAARNHVVTIIGGDVHLRGSLTEGACVISAESEDMHVDMGQYRNDNFLGVGSESSRSIPFVVHLTDCNPALATRIGISFNGMTDPKEPDAFLVISGDGSPVGVSGKEGFSGLGLIINDEYGNTIFPDTVPHTTYKIEGRDVLIPFTAHYRASSNDVYPGALHSEVDFHVIYP